MIKKNWKTLLITSIIILLPIIAGVLLWDRLPAQIPSHWDVNGNVDGWLDKPMFVFGMPLFMLAVQWLCALGTGADPKKANHSEKVQQLVLWIIPLINLVLCVITYATALGQEVAVDVVLPLMLGFIFTVIGNYMPKCKQNYTIGIKIPWTLNSEENWNRTHRFAGRLWLVCGILIMLTGFFGGFEFFVAIVAVMVLAPFLYSYILYRKGI